MSRKKKTTKPARKIRKGAIGRPPIISEQMVSDIVGAIHAGAYMETAAAQAGISKDTLYAWLKRGARAMRAVFDEETGEYRLQDIPKNERIYVTFSDALKKAQAVAEGDAVKKITDAKEWQAHAWWLERRFPSRYGRRTQATATLSIGDGEYDDGKPHAPAGEKPDPVEDVAKLDPRNPMRVSVTLAIGDREVDEGDLDD